MSLTSLKSSRSISSRTMPGRPRPSLASRADSRRVSVSRLARPVRASILACRVLRNIVPLRLLSETMTTAIDGSAQGPSRASAASSGAVIRLTPQIRTLLPNRSHCSGQRRGAQADQRVADQQRVQHDDHHGQAQAPRRAARVGFGGGVELPDGPRDGEPGDGQPDHAEHDHVQRPAATTVRSAGTAPRSAR